MTPTLPDLAITEAAIVEMTNAFRAEQKLGAVGVSASLTAAARAYAAYLAKSGQFSHTADGREAGDRVTAARYEWCEVAENLALHLDSRGFASRALAEQSVEGWKNSPGHRANMMAPYVTEIGVGVVRAPDQDPKFIAVQLFARPKALQYTFEIKNGTTASIGYAFAGESHDIGPRYTITHTACAPSELKFNGLGKESVTSKFTASDGVVYALQPDGNGGTKVETSARQVKP